MIPGPITLVMFIIGLLSRPTILLGRSVRPARIFSRKAVCHLHNGCNLSRHYTFWFSGQSSRLAAMLSKPPCTIDFRLGSSLNVLPCPRDCRLDLGDSSRELIRESTRVAAFSCQDDARRIARTERPYLMIEREVIMRSPRADPRPGKADSSWIRSGIGTCFWPNPFADFGAVWRSVAAGELTQGVSGGRPPGGSALCFGISRSMYSQKLLHCSDRAVLDISSGQEFAPCLESKFAELAGQVSF
jgi:hypothetical protein